MELKSSSRRIRIVGVAGIVTGICLMATGHSIFGTAIFGCGVVFLLLPFYRTSLVEVPAENNRGQ